MEFYTIFSQKIKCAHLMSKIESKGRVHIMCRCVNYNTINNICVYRADNFKHDYFFIFVKFHKGFRQFT